MSTPTALARAAAGIIAAYAGRAADARGAAAAALKRVAERQALLGRAARRLSIANARGLPLAANVLKDAALAELRAVRRLADEAVDLLARRPWLPNPAEVLSEMRQIDDEFGGVAADRRQKTLTAVTEPVDLDATGLGRFAMRFCWDRLTDRADGSCFEVESLEPNPAAIDPSVTHPHVRGGVLCAGDADNSLQLALAQGRLADAFLLVRQVLLTYNPDSAYVALSEWEGEPCGDCGWTVSVGEDLFCDGCSQGYCRDCTDSCSGCDRAFCLSCLGRCAACGEFACADWLETSPYPAGLCCAGCRGRCSACGTAAARDSLDRTTGACPDCARPTADAAEAGACGSSVTGGNRPHDRRGRPGVRFRRPGRGRTLRANALRARTGVRRPMHGPVDRLRGVRRRRADGGPVQEVAAGLSGRSIAVPELARR